MTIRTMITTISRQTGQGSDNKIPKSGDVAQCLDREECTVRGPDKEAREGGRSYDGPWT